MGTVVPVGRPVADGPLKAGAEAVGRGMATTSTSLTRSARATLSRTCCPTVIAVIASETSSALARVRPFTPRSSSPVTIPAAAAGPDGTTSTIIQRPAEADSATDIPSQPGTAARLGGGAAVRATLGGAEADGTAVGSVKGRAIGSPIEMSPGWNAVGGGEAGSASAAPATLGAASLATTHAATSSNADTSTARRARRDETSNPFGGSTASCMRPSIRSPQAAATLRCGREIAGLSLQRPHAVHKFCTVHGCMRRVWRASATLAGQRCRRRLAAPITPRCCHGLTALHALLYSRRVVDGRSDFRNATQGRTSPKGRTFGPQGRIHGERHRRRRVCRHAGIFRG